MSHCQTTWKDGNWNALTKTRNSIDQIFLKRKKKSEDILLATLLNNKAISFLSPKLVALSR